MLRAATLVTLVVFTCCVLLTSRNSLTASAKRESELATHQQSRNLLFELVNCTPPAVNDFPADLFSQQERQQGAIVLHCLAAIYAFLGLALACDEYFVPSLQILCDKCNIQEDVAGATFMAAGSSAPELATTIIGVFVAKNDIGLGTIVGSAVFNVLFVPAVCALAAGMVCINSISQFFIVYYRMSILNTA